MLQDRRFKSDVTALSSKAGRSTAVVLPQPSMPGRITRETKQSSVKAATPDVILLDQETLEAETLAILDFNQMAGVEIIQIARHDLVNGQVPDYGIIRNISEIELKNNSRNIIRIPESSQIIFDSFAINFANYTTNTASAPSAYFDLRGNLIIEIRDPKPSYEVEVEILTSGSILDDTIYT